MEKVNLSSEIEILTYAELDHIEQTLISRAQAVSRTAYAPTRDSRRVGDFAGNGEVMQSSNQENASFPTGICAERLVLGYAGANYPNHAPVMLAVVAQRAGEEAWAGVSPCGICRQTINEAEVRFGKQITMLFCVRMAESIERMESVVCCR